MKCFLPACMLMATAISAQAQLVSSLNFSTGYDNITNAALSVGQRDADWIVTNVAGSLIATGPLPYSSYTQTPWPSTSWATGPSTAANTQWISYSATGMTASAPADIAGDGRNTYKYTFETCGGDDNIQINATMRSDNRITAIRVDGINTGFSQPSITNWITGTTFSYSKTMVPGMHTVEVDVENTASTAAYNPIGLNVSGTITSANSRIVDRSNFPDYAGCCNPNFHYSMGSGNPYSVNFTADNSSQPGTYSWKVNGSNVGSGPNISYTCAAAGSYYVCMAYTPKQGEACEQCLTICVADNPPGKLDVDVNTGSLSFGISKIYPNPAGAKVNIELVAAASGTPVSVKLYDLMGKLVVEESAVLSRAQKNISVSTSQLPAGVYALHISDGVSVVVEHVQIEK